MTRDYRRKKDVRDHAARTQRTYLDAATALSASHQTGVSLARDLRDALAAGLDAAGWPVEIEPMAEGTGLRLYAGPATISVDRENDLRSFSGDEHPDDPDLFDLSKSLRVLVWAPLIVDYSESLGRVVGVDAHEIRTGGTVSEIVAEVDRVVNQARRRDDADEPVDGECGICGDDYPMSVLFEATTARLSVCPACAFDGDLLGAHPAQLAYQIDQAASRSVALPAGWAAVQALLGSLGGSGFHDWLTRRWKAAGTLFVPLEWWHSPAKTWIWLPPAFGVEATR